MILPDVNVLVHAHNSDSPFHQAVRAWWDRFPGLRWINPCSDG